MKIKKNLIAIIGCIVLLIQEIKLLKNKQRKCNYKQTCRKLSVATSAIADEKYCNDHLTQRTKLEKLYKDTYPKQYKERETIKKAIKEAKEITKEIEKEKYITRK